MHQTLCVLVSGHLGSSDSSLVRGSHWIESLSVDLLGGSSSATCRGSYRRHGVLKVPHYTDGRLLTVVPAATLAGLRWDTNDI